MVDFKVSFRADIEDYTVIFDDGEDYMLSFDDGEDYAASFGEVYNISDGGFDSGYEYGYEKGYDAGITDAGAVWYEGEYEITPKVTAQTLETENKMMSDDLTIKAIPYFEVSNMAGGSTVTIGNMDD